MDHLSKLESRDQCTLDRRSFAAGSIEFRAAGEGSGSLGRIEGRAVPYGVWTRIGSMFEERFEPGAFTEYLAGGGDVVYNYHHQREAIMGRRSSGTLDVEERDDGVYISLDIPDTQLGRDMREMVRRGDITGHSIEFKTMEDMWEYARESGEGEDALEMDRRTVMVAELPGVALTWDPAYADTSAALRSREAARDASKQQPAATDSNAARLREAEARARMAGLSTEATS